MSKIVNIHGHVIPSTVRVTPAQCVHHLRALWVCGEIQQDGYFLGAIALAAMQRHGAPTVSLTRRDAMSVYTNVRGNVFTGPVSAELLEFTIALQQLHKFGILNDIEEHKFDEADAAERHFTLSPQLRNNERWGVDTPIYFRLPTASHEVIGEQVKTAFQQRMSKLTAALDLNLQ